MTHSFRRTKKHPTPQISCVIPKSRGLRQTSAYWNVERDKCGWFPPNHIGQLGRIPPSAILDKMASVAIFGVGDIGGTVLKGLAMHSEVNRIIIFDKSAQRVAMEAFDAAAVASYHERGPRIEPHQVDMDDEEVLADALHAARPDVIVHAATMQSWWATSSLHPATQRRLEHGARFGPWLPLHLPLMMKLMRARVAAGIDAPVVNVSYPDAVNPILSRLGLAPACGAGNSDLLVSAIRVSACGAHKFVRASTKDSDPSSTDYCRPRAGSCLADGGNEGRSSHGMLSILPQ